MYATGTAARKLREVVEVSLPADKRRNVTRTKVPTLVGYIILCTMYMYLVHVPYKSLIIKDFCEIHGFKGTRCSDHHEIATSDYWTVGSTPEMDFSQAFEKV